MLNCQLISMVGNDMKRIQDRLYYRRRRKEKTQWQRFLREKEIWHIISDLSETRVGKYDQAGWPIGTLHHIDLASTITPFIKHLLDMLDTSYRRRFQYACWALNRIFRQWVSEYPVKDEKQV